MQSDQNISTENLQAETREVEERLEALEQRGVDLEKNLRDCNNGASSHSCELGTVQLLYQYPAVADIWLPSA